MSTMKEYASRLEVAHEAADSQVYSAAVALQDLADMAWSGDEAIWAPDREWLAATRMQLNQGLLALAELEAARDSIDLA